MDDIKLFAKNEKELDTGSTNIQPGYRNIMCHVYNEKRETTYNGQKNQEKITILGKKLTYKYLGILEVDTIKQVEIKEILRKSISGE